MTAERLLRLLSLFTVRRCWAAKSWPSGSTSPRAPSAGTSSGCAAWGTGCAPYPARTPVRPETLALLALACRDGERLRFGYTDSQGISSSRHVEPYRLVFTDRLVARDLGKGDWRSFRLDRLDNPLATGQRSSPADPPDAARFVAEGIGSARRRLAGIDDRPRYAK
jgi:hypothetical protein